MCFYIFSPECNTEILFQAETIFLDKDGSSTVVADCLLSNISADTVERLLIIYPNQFLNVSPDVDDIKSLEEILPSNNPRITVDTSRFFDLSDTFLDERSKYNTFFNAFRINAAPDSGKEVPPWASLVGIKIPSPTCAANTILKGLVGGENIFDLEFLETFQRIILHAHKFTVFSYTFDHGIEPGDYPRWVRLQFKGLYAASRPITGIDAFYKKAMNNLKYDYDIIGPSNVRNNFSRIITQLHDLNKIPGKKKVRNHQFKRRVLELHSLFSQNGLLKNKKHPPAETAYENIFLFIKPEKSSTIEVLRHSETLENIDHKDLLSYARVNIKNNGISCWRTKAPSESDFYIQFESLLFFPKVVLWSLAGVAASLLGLFLGFKENIIDFAKKLLGYMLQSLEAAL